MFGRKRMEKTQTILEIAKKDREMFAEQAEKDRAIMTEQVSALKNDTITLVEAINRNYMNFTEQAEKDRTVMATQFVTLKDDTAKVNETINNDRKLFAEQAEKDRQVILKYIESVKKNIDEPAIKEGDELKAAYALNLCTVSVSQIIEYNDLGIMEQEYDNILNNLNLQNFPKDEALLKILKQILDVISFFRIQDGEKKLLEEQYKKKVKNAIWSAIPSPSVILAGGKAGWAGLAVSAISAVGTGYMNYRKERANIDDEKKQKDWELQKTAMEQFHALRRELFDTAWRLADAHNFIDTYRLTARQISQYNKILLEEDAIKRYERLDYISENFYAYPPFWYNLGHAAAEVFHNEDLSENIRKEYKQKAIISFEKFMVSTDEDKNKSLLREDPLRAACALEKFAIIASDKDVLTEDKVKLLKTAAKNSGNAFDTLQLCASSYLELGVNDEAMKLLRMLVNEGYNSEMNAQLLSMLYISIPNNTYKNDHETLLNRGYQNFMFPWPENNLDTASAKKHTRIFLEEQNKYLFDNYKITIGDYITKCRGIFDDISKHSDDISKELINFLNGIKTDMETLFGEKFSKNICNLLADGILNHPNAINILENIKARREDKSFNFDSISKKAIDQMASRIKEQVSYIRNQNTEEESLKAVAGYMNNLFLFKAQTKLLGGTAIYRNKESSVKTPFEKLVEQSKKNQADQEFMDIIKKYEKENKLILENGKKSKVNFITENILEAHHIKNKEYIKENIGINKILAYLDTNNDDILFTIEGVYRYGHRTSFAPYNSGKIKLIENKELQIDSLPFKHEQVDIKALYEMIEQLSNLAPCNMIANTQFIDLVGEFPAKGLSNSDLSKMENMEQSGNKLYLDKTVSETSEVIKILDSIDKGAKTSKSDYGIIYKQARINYCGKKGRLVWDYIFVNELTFEDIETGNQYSLMKSRSDHKIKEIFNEIVNLFGENY